MDIARLIDGSKEIEKVLDGKLFAVVTHDESPAHLSECFQEAQELVASASVLLGCPENERERYAHADMLGQGQRPTRSSRFAPKVGTVATRPFVRPSTLAHCVVIMQVQEANPWGFHNRTLCSHGVEAQPVVDNSLWCCRDREHDPQAEGSTRGEQQ